MSEREELLEAFWDAACDDERCWVAERADDPRPAGENTCVDGYFNIWAGIQAVIAASKEVPDE